MLWGACFKGKSNASFFLRVSFVVLVCFWVQLAIFFVLLDYSIGGRGGTHFHVLKWMLMATSSLACCCFWCNYYWWWWWYWIKMQILETPSLLAEGSSGVKKNIFKQKPSQDVPTSNCCSWWLHTIVLAALVEDITSFFLLSSTYMIILGKWNITYRLAKLMWSLCSFIILMNPCLVMAHGFLLFSLYQYFLMMKWIEQQQLISVCKSKQIPQFFFWDNC